MSSQRSEFERNLIRERTVAGLKAARARGRRGGRPAKLSAKEIKTIRTLLKTVEIPVTPEALEANFKVVEFLKDLAARKKITPAQIALAWLLAQKPWIVPIPGGTKMEHLDDNLPAVEVRLSGQDLREIDQAFATIDIKGAPLSAALDAALDR
jgi:aryl-alcohol dehydrogenase-like predicted oxidoreductase